MTSFGKRAADSDGEASLLSHRQGLLSAQSAGATLWIWIVLGTNEVLDAVCDLHGSPTCFVWMQIMIVLQRL